ncbi:hypothetical protein C8Q79DRAFT_1011976 [Trametes meyenii]|nr:hypothetical protein C8Q79DRAFT_1011976 [Trametes meyenii]
MPCHSVASLEDADTTRPVPQGRLEALKLGASRWRDGAPPSQLCGPRSELTLMMAITQASRCSSGGIAGMKEEVAASDGGEYHARPTGTGRSEARPIEEDGYRPSRYPAFSKPGMTVNSTAGSVAAAGSQHRVFAGDLLPASDAQNGIVVRARFAPLRTAAVGHRGKDVQGAREKLAKIDDELKSNSVPRVSQMLSDDSGYRRARCYPLDPPRETFFRPPVGPSHDGVRFQGRRACKRVDMGRRSPPVSVY